MKQTLYAVIATVLLSLASVSCKTSEANYKAAYDIALKKQESGVDRNVSAFIEREKHLAEYRSVNGDSVRVVRERVRMIDGVDADMCDYGIVVGDFKQIFNARSFRKRVNDVENDTVSPAYVVTNPEKRYYVIYKGFSGVEDAAKFIREKKFKMALQLDEPWILELQK